MNINNAIQFIKIEILWTSVGGNAVNCRQRYKFILNFPLKCVGIILDSKLCYKQEYWNFLDAIWRKTCNKVKHNT